MISDVEVKRIVGLIVEEFKVFGGGKDPEDNPIAIAMKDKEPVFAAGVNVEQVVKFVLYWASKS